MARQCLAVILAAGESRRMRSSLSKVLHPIAGLPMIAHVVRAVAAASADAVALVVGRNGDAVENAARGYGPAAETFVQTERLGTAHAVLAARAAIARGFDDLLVLFGDTPLVTAETLAGARAALAGGADLAVIGFRTDRPTGYGRLIEDSGALVAIREEKDASAAERAITFCNGGLMAIAGDRALKWLEAVGNDNAKGEFYLTDIVEIAHAAGCRVVAVEAAEEELIGVDDRARLAAAEAVWQRRRRHDMLAAGVSMIAPETVFFSHDTQIAADVTIEPNVFFGPGVTIAGGARIRAFSHVEGAMVGEGSEVGPFARLRPGAELAARVKIGNFCEVKAAEIGEGAKVNHLSYIGDASLGAGVNIGAGTITCNYDGVEKHRTEIGAGTFVGSSSALVAPVSVGAGAYIASGSVITDPVPDDALAFGRARQINKDGRAVELRSRLAARKTARQTGAGGTG